jgi:hypothetical protein
MRGIAGIVAAVAMCVAGVAAEPRWKYDEKKDDITGEKVRTVAVVADDKASMLALSVTEGKRAKLVLMPKDVMFPDKVSAESKRMGIDVTMRSTAMDKPVAGKWTMPWMDYKSCSAATGTAFAQTKVFGGESVTFQLDKTGKRYKFMTQGEGMEGLQEAVAKVAEIAAEDKPATAEK